VKLGENEKGDMEWNGGRKKVMVCVCVCLFYGDCSIKEHEKKLHFQEKSF